MGKFNVYLGDIDPNNTIISARDIRRNIMFQLLMWDSIVLSDSQYLTDPRINILMKGFQDDSVCREYSISDVEEYSKGFEHLIEAGLVEIACREVGGQVYDMSNVWSKMIHNTDKNVPYLPKEQNYANYLDSLGGKRRFYKIENMGSRFKHNLNAGTENGGILLSRDNDTDRTLQKMFNEDNVLFRNILFFLKDCKERGKISQQRYDELYQYVYSCYSVNISAETDCYINTKFNNLPFHLESGTGDFDDHLPQDRVNEMRPTWALNPYFLDYLSFEDFVEMRKKLQTIVQEGRIMKYFTGSSTEEEWKDTRDAWESYTQLLEANLNYYIQKTANEINSKYIEEFAKQPKYLKKPEQFTLIKPGLEFVKNVISTWIPALGTLLGLGDLTKSGVECICALSRRQDTISMLKQRELINEFVKSNPKVITNYSDTRNDG